MFILMDLIENPQIIQPLAIHIFELAFPFLDMQMVTGIP